MAEEPIGRRIAEARSRKGLSQKDFASLMGRSESWVSQVERGVLPVDRIAIRQKLTEILGVSFVGTDGTVTQAAYPTPVHTDLDRLRTALTGHPAMLDLFREPGPAPAVGELQADADEAWKRALDSDFGPLAEMIPRLEGALRQVTAEGREAVLAMLARSYQAASAGFARQNEGDAAWVAADRALRVAEQTGDPLSVVAGQFRLAHTMMRLRLFDQARAVASTTIEALEGGVDSDQPREAVALLGAMHLVLAALAGFDNDRSAAREALDEAERLADIVGEGRNDYDTEFSPTNVQIHRVSIAVDLGDAGEAIEVAKRIDTSSLSNERQMRLLLDTARAHIQRRQFADAIAKLTAAEQVAPEHLRSHTVAHQTVGDLLAQRDGQESAELTALAERLGVTAHR
jgi:transcriptional regulator with XRE-family HTH domain